MIDYISEDEMSCDDCDSIQDDYDEESWHSDDDFVHRGRMSQIIIDLLKDRVSNAEQSWIDKLPLMVEMLESLLYTSAPSLAVYIDQHTLKERLHRVSMEMVQEIRSQTNGEDASIALLEEQLNLFTF